MKLRTLRAFTLIELLVVIAVIGILAAIVLTQFGGTRQSAQDAKALTQAKQAQTAASNCRLSTLATTPLILGQPAAGAITGGGNICDTATTESATWTDLTNTGWSWPSTVTNGTAPAFSYTLTGPTVGATTKTITCTAAGCTKSNF